MKRFPLTCLIRRDMVLERWKAQDKVRDRKKKSRAAIEKKLMAAIEKGEVEGLLKKETKSILKEEVEKARYKKVDDEAEEVATLMPRTWVTLHVYISTTHEDMHCERDVMMEDVFPSLNTRLRYDKTATVLFCDQYPSYQSLSFLEIHK